MKIGTTKLPTPRHRLNKSTQTGSMRAADDQAFEANIAQNYQPHSVTFRRMAEICRSDAIAGLLFTRRWWPACPGRAALTEFCPSRDRSQNRLAISSGSISGLVTFHHSASLPSGAAVDDGFGVAPQIRR